jgi:hypothetical protein
MVNVILFGFNHAEIMVDAAFTAIAIPLFAQQGVKSVLCERVSKIEQDLGHATVTN